MCPVSALTSLVEHIAWQLQHLFQVCIAQVCRKFHFKFFTSTFTYHSLRFLLCNLQSLYWLIPFLPCVLLTRPRGTRDGVVCSNNILTPLPVYMQVQTRSSFPHFPAHEPLPLLPIKRVHRGATRPLLGGKLGLTVWTGHSAPGFILFLTPRWNLTWKHRNYLK